MFKRLPAHISLFIKVYVSTLVIYTLFRFILFTTELGRLDEATAAAIIRAFLIGIRFDSVIISYIISLPFALLFLLSLFRVQGSIRSVIVGFSKYYLIVLFSVSFLIGAADIPYFNQFFKRFSVAAFQWLDSPLFMLKMIFGEIRYWVFLIIFIVLVAAFIVFINSIFKQFLQAPLRENRVLILFLTIVCAGGIFIGIRGRIEKKATIKIGTAYFCNNPYLNQLGLNPTFTFIRSALDELDEQNKHIEFIQLDTAIQLVHKQLGITQADSTYPLLRLVEFNNEQAKPYNVIIILMESMSAGKLKRHGNTDNLTPFLDSLTYHGYYFPHAYSSGIHTMNGVFSTLFSYPALFKQHPMKESLSYPHMGIYPTLKAHGYSTAYFTTHDGQFDNIEGFLKANECETFISQPNYPKSEVKSTLGVPDDYMFRFSIPIINDIHKKGKPFFATMLTASDHGPFYVPEYFTPRSANIRQQVIEYADYSLQTFMHLASQQEWFDSTLFVFVADHGAPLDNVYDMALLHNHIPLLFYAPGIITQPKTIETMASQVDIFPTIMGMLKLPYYNNTLGLDLFTTPRTFALINAYNYYGVMSKDWFLMVNHRENTKKLYDYTHLDTKNYAELQPEIVTEMNNFGTSQLQLFQYIRKEQLQVAPTGYIPTQSK